MISSGPLTTACKIETLYAKLANMNHQQKLRLAEAWVDIVYVLKLIYFYTNVKFRIFCPLLSSICFDVSSCLLSLEQTLNLHRSLNFLTRIVYGYNAAKILFVRLKSLYPVFRKQQEPVTCFWNDRWFGCFECELFLCHEAQWMKVVENLETL